MVRQGVVVVGMACLLTSCAQQQTEENVAKHAGFEGEAFAEEVRAQSPFEKVELTWQEAFELMKVRNPDYRKAVLGYAEATSKMAMTDNIGGQMGMSLGNTVRGVFDPEEVIKTLKDPVSGLPDQFESVSSLKDVGHNMEQKEWKDSESASLAEQQRRQEVVKLQVLFRQGMILDEHLQWVAKVDPEIDPKAKAVLAKHTSQLKADRKKWLSEVRDFFNAEYYDVKLRGGSRKLRDYQGVTRPDFANWKRWGALQRKAALTKELKKQHAEQKPMIPGANLVADRLDAMFHGEPGATVELPQKDMRDSARKMIRSWREMKVAQEKARELKAALARTDDEAEKGLGGGEIAKLGQLYNFENAELASVRTVWLMDEECWKD